MAAASTGRPHRRKERIPPGPGRPSPRAALRSASPLASTAAICHRLHHITATDSTVIDLSAYERAAQQRNTLQ